MNENPRGFVAVAAEKIDGEGRSWIEVIPTADKARNGRWYFTITREDLDTVVSSIGAQAGRIPVDYDHEGMEGGSTRAAGWFTGEAQVIEAGSETPVDGAAEHDAVWAEVQWTPQAVKEIRDGAFRFMSPEWEMSEVDKKSGLLTQFKDLVASTLTNRPFFKQMTPVTAKELFTADELDALTAKFGEDMKNLVLVSAEADGEKLKEAVAALIARTAEEDQKAQRLPDDANKATEEKEVAESTDYLKALGLDETSEPNTRIAKALNAKDEQIVSLTAEITDLKAQVAEGEKLNERIEDLEKRDRARDIEVLLSKAVGSGRVAPAEKEKLAELFGDNVHGLKELVATRAAGMFTPKEKGVGGVPRYSLDDPDVSALTSEFGDDIDADSAKLHLATIEVLKRNGKASDYTPDDYITASSEASKSLA